MVANHSATSDGKFQPSANPPMRIVCGDETVNKHKEHVDSFVWAVIALCAAGSAIALLAVAAAATQRSRRRAELAEVTPSDGTQIPETRIEVVAISDADPDHHGDTIERE